ncbi:hypothetical protein D3C80_2065500 [compost metagenome]
MRGTAAAEDAFIQPVEPGALLGGLEALDGRCRIMVDQPWLDALVLLKEETLVDHQVTNDRHAGQRSDD